MRIVTGNSEEDELLSQMSKLIDGRSIKIVLRAMVTFTAAVFVSHMGWKDHSFINDVANDLYEILNKYAPRSQQ